MRFARRSKPGRLPTRAPGSARWFSSQIADQQPAPAHAAQPSAFAIRMVTIEAVRPL